MIDVLRMANAVSDTPLMWMVKAAGEARSAAEVLAGAAPRFPFPGLPPRSVDRTPDLVAAVLAAGMIAATGRQHSAGEAVDVWKNVQNCMVVV